MEISRRDLCALFPAAALLTALPLQSEPTETLSNSQVFPFDKLPVHRSADGGASRPVLQGKLPTGEMLEVHETTLPPGEMPHPPHHHLHSECSWCAKAPRGDGERPRSNHRPRRSRLLRFQSGARHQECRQNACAVFRGCGRPWRLICGTRPGTVSIGGSSNRIISVSKSRVVIPSAAEGPASLLKLQTRSLP